MDTLYTVLEPDWLLPIVPKNVLHTGYSLVMRGDRIEALLPREEARVRHPEARFVPLPGHILLPGFVNLHSHAAMNLVRGLGADLPLMDWLTTKIWPAEGKLMSPEFVEEGSRLAGLEMLSGGVTTTSDHYFFPLSAAKGLRRAGLRAAVSAFIIGFPSAYAKNDGEYLEKMEETILAVRDAGDPLVTATVAPHAPYTVSDDSLRRCAEISERYNLPVHMHVHETAVEVSDSVRDHGVRPLARLDRLGLVNDRLVAVHGVHFNDEEIALLAERGASMCHCPASNLKLASGFAPVVKLLKAGVNVGIGTDGAASNDKLDLLGDTRIAGMLAKAVAGDTTSATVADMLEAATLGGARALHLDHEIGSLEAGKAADLVAVDLSSVESLPTFDPAAQLLYASGREHVTHVWVAGRLLVEKKATIRYDGADLSETVRESAKHWASRL